MEKKLNKKDAFISEWLLEIRLFVSPNASRYSSSPNGNKKHHTHTHTHTHTPNNKKKKLVNGQAATKERRIKGGREFLDNGRRFKRQLHRHTCIKKRDHHSITARKFPRPPPPPLLLRHSPSTRPCGSLQQQQQQQ